MDLPGHTARLALFAVAATTACASGVAFWTQSGAFPLDHVAFYTCSAAPLGLGLVALVAAFSPFDRPGSAPRWVAPLVGSAVGIGTAGLLLYPATFVWLSPPLLLYAWLLRRLARAVATRPPPPDAGDSQIGPRLEDDPRRQAPAPGRGVAYAAAFVGAALALAWWPPAGGARPLPLDAEVAAVATAPPDRHGSRRVVRHPSYLELNGNQTQVQVSLRRPRVLAGLRRERIVVEPCLHVTRGTLDGFLPLPGLNAYRHLEPRGLALADMAEGRRVGWAQARFRSATARAWGLAAAFPGLGRPATEEVSATVDVAVDLEAGVVTIDARTRVPRPLSIMEASLGWVRIEGVMGPEVTFGLNGAYRVEAPRGPRPERTELLVCEGEVVRALRAKRADQGPYETLNGGPFAGWWSVQGRDRTVLVVAPDWTRQASLEPARGAGHGLRANGLVYWREDGSLTFLLDPGSSRLGPAPLTTQLPPGIYRNRIVVATLAPDELAGVRAARELRRIGAAPEQ